MSFSNIIGHVKEIDTLKRALSGQKVAHSFLFSGPDGVGKRLVARAFAKALNCSGKGEGQCRCHDCAMTEAGTHPNIIEVWPSDKDGERSDDGLIRIDRIREVQSALRFRIDRGAKAVIVDCADRLMAQAANAFLKTLEEPPHGTVIMLITSYASSLLPTILSRCQRINFKPLADELVAGFLESRGVPAAQAAAAARLNSGSLSKALRYAESGADEKRREVIARLCSIGPLDADKALKFAEELSKDDGLDEVFDILKGWYRDMAVLGEGAGRLAADSGLSRGAGAARAGSVTPWDSFSMIERARLDIMAPRYANRQLTLESLIMGLAGCAENR